MTRAETAKKRHAAVLTTWRALQDIPGLNARDRQLAAHIIRAGYIPQPQALRMTDKQHAASLDRLKRALGVDVD